MELNELQRAMTDSAALRRRQRLQPVGGPGDKVFPPTFPGDTNQDPAQHVFEQRRIHDSDGSLRPDPVDCVLLDSVQSQANRLEEALLRCVRERDCELPHVTVSFDGTTVAELGEITSLEAPHRIYDAIFRDSLDGEVPFMEGELGEALKRAAPSDAIALLESSPTSALFGAWHSQGQGGGVGSKFARCIVSEIIGVGAELGRRAAVRTDPLGASRDVTPLRDKEGNWSFDKSEVGEGAKPVKPSELNHGNIITKVEDRGVTFEYAEQTVVLTLAGLRRLRFGSDARDRAGRVYLAALGLLAIKELDRTGYALRSRCDLVPETPAPLELVHADGTVESLTLSADDARALYDEALAAARKAGLRLDAAPRVLRPQGKLVTLIQKSRERALAGKGGAED